MNKRILFVALVVLVMLAGIRIYYWMKPVARNSSLIRAVPVDAAFFLEINKPAALDKKYSSLPYYSSLKSLAFYRKASDLFSLLTPLINRQSGWQDAFYNQTILVSYHLTRADNFDPLLVVDLHKAGKPDLTVLLNSLGNSLSFTKRNVMNKDVFDIRFIPSGKTLTLSCIDKILIVSTESFLVEDGMSQLAGRASLFEQENFLKLEKSSKDNFEAVLYFSYKNLADFMGGFASVEAQPLTNSVSSFAEWSAVDLLPEPTGIRFEGNTIATRANWLSFFTQSAVQNQLAKSFAPDNTALLLQSGLSSENTAIDKLNPALAGDADFKKYMRPWMGSQTALMLTQPVSNSFLPQSFLILETKNEALSSKLLNEWAAAKAVKDTVSTLTTYKGKTINQLKVGELFNSYFKSSLVYLNNPFFTVTNHAVIFSNSLNQLKLILDKYSDGNTLAKRKTDGLENSIRSQYSVYIDLLWMKDFFGTLGSDSLVTSLAGGFDVAKQFSPVQINYSAEKDFYRTTGKISFSKSGAVTEKYLWKTTLDTTALTAPQIVLSAKGDNNMVAIQDVNNTLYLLNKGGDIVWKKRLDTPLKGRISQFDFYENGQLQMIFATEGKIYLIKMDGSPVNNFPITLSAQVTSPLQVIDFDGVHQYRFFVACNNGSIYGFEKSGKPLAGWNPNAGVGIVNIPVQFYKTPDKEFILAVTVDGTLQFFNRNGKKVAGEIKLKTQFNSPFAFSKQNILTAVDTSGRIYSFGMDGKIGTNDLISRGRGISSMVLRSSGDTTDTYVLMNTEHLWGMTSRNDYIFDYKFTNSSQKQLFLLSDPLTRKAAIGVTDANSNQIYLFSNEGNLYPAFPKPGSSEFAFDDLFWNKTKAVITCINGNEVIAYGL